VEAEWEKTDEFHDAWKLKARDMLARAEFRRRKLTKRVRDVL
jgi:DnaJ family protein C protein 8